MIPELALSDPIQFADVSPREDDPRALRSRAFDGTVLRVRDAAGARLGDVARSWLERRFSGSVQGLADRWRAADWPEANAAQRAFAESEELLAATLDCLRDLGFGGPARLGRPRLRVVFPDGHHVAAARAAYDAHRDTWFANPQTQINVWLPLLDVDEASSFGFHPGRFATAVANTSSEFDYEAWSRAGGFQGPHTPQKPVHPTVTQALGPATRFALPADALLLFSASHLHGTLPVGGAARLSLDFRAVFADRVGAPNVDNRSTGDAAVDYRAV